MIEEVSRGGVLAIAKFPKTGDHLRNHGFLYASRRGWRLSPAYDLNPAELDRMASAFAND